MKNIKYIITLLVLITASTVFAQQSGIWKFQYDMGIPTGNTKDYINSFSARGLAIEGETYISENISIGGRAAWNVFYKNIGWVQEHIIINIDGNKSEGDIYGYEKRYINILPLMATAHYTFNNDKFIPYAGLGVGTYYIEKSKQMGIYIIPTDSWHFGLAPEAGIVIPLGKTSNWGINLNVRYNWAAKTKNIDAQSWLNTSVGLSYLW